MAKPKTLKMSSFKVISSSKRRTGVQDFGDLVPEDTKGSLVDYAGQTIYIVKLERKEGTQYGNGYVVSYKDLPNAAETMTAGVFGVVPLKQLDVLWQITHEGKTISLDSPVGAVIEEVPTKHGMSYKFAPIKK